MGCQANTVLNRGLFKKLLFYFFVIAVFFITIDINTPLFAQVSSQKNSIFTGNDYQKNNLKRSRFRKSTLRNPYFKNINLQKNRKISSATWERKASLAALKRYNTFCKKNSAFLKKELKYFPPKKVPVSNDIKKQFKKSDFIIFSRTVNEKTPKYIAPTQEEINIKSFKICSAINQWESLQIGIWALKDLKHFSYEVSNLVHKNGKDIISGSGNNIRKYYPYNIFARKQESREVSPDMDIDPERVTKRGVVFYEEEPVVLLDLPDINIASDTAQALWIDVYVGRDTQPGDYRGKITFKVNGKKIADKPFILTVYPFELDEARNWSRGAYISKFIDKKEAVNLMENGHNQVSWWTTGGYSIKLENGKIKADFSPYVKYLKMLDDVGMAGPHVVFLGGDSPKLINKISDLLNRKGIKNGRNIKLRMQYLDSDLSEPFESYFVNTLKQYYQQMNNAGHGDLVSVILDEPDHKPNPERLNWYNKVYGMLENGIPELPTMGVFYHKGDEKKLSHHHSVWSTNRPSQKLYDACKKAGKKLYTYHGGFKFYDAPGKYRFDIGIIPWVYNASGTFYWAIWNHSDKNRHLDDVFSPDTFEGRSTTIARAPYGADYGPLSTLVHKGFREAVDDARYIKTLETLIKISMNTKAESEAKKYQKWLKNIQLTLRKKLYIRGGHVQNHKKISEWYPPVSGLKFKNSLGETCDLSELNISELNKFSEFFRKDVIRRILSLKKAVEKKS